MRDLIAISTAILIFLVAAQAVSIKSVDELKEFFRTSYIQRAVGYLPGKFFKWDSKLINLCFSLTNINCMQQRIPTVGRSNPMPPDSILLGGSIAFITYVYVAAVMVCMWRCRASRSKHSPILNLNLHSKSGTNTSVADSIVHFQRS